MTTSPKQFLIYGTGGFAREVFWLAENSVDTGVTLGFIDDHAVERQTLHGVPVLPLEAAARRFPGAGFVAAVGNPGTRRRLVTGALKAGLEPVTLVHKRVERSKTVSIGPGAVICAGSILTVDIIVGEYAQINLDCTVGHDCVLEPYVTLAPGVHISGNVRLHVDAYIGTGACIINGSSDAPLTIGRNAIVGAGAVVTKPVPDGVTVMGVPARARS